MGIPSNVMGVRASKRSSFMAAASPNEPRVIDSKISPTQVGRLSSHSLGKSKFELYRTRTNHISRRNDFGDSKFLDSAFISDELSEDYVLSLSIDLMEIDSSSSSNSSDHLLDLLLLMANLPIKRGLSQFFQEKSQSFNCLYEASCIEDLAKKENPYSKRMKYCRRTDERMLPNKKSHYAPNIYSIFDAFF